MDERRLGVALLIRDAFYFMHYDLFVGKNKQAGLLHLINKLFWQAAVESRDIMAEKTKKTAKTSDYNAVKFVNRNLSDEEKNDHDAASRPVAMVATQALKLVLGGYTLKVAFDAYSKCFQATLLVWSDANPNFGYGLSARGATPERAVSILLYKHYDVLKEDWKTYYTPPVNSFEG